MDKSQLKEIYNWYYKPGEVLRSIGFYINPYKQWSNAKFRHIFAFDALCNLYVGQYSVYHEHIKNIFNLEDRREYGFIYPKNPSIKPIYSKSEVEEFGIEQNTTTLVDKSDLVLFEFMENKNITYLNLRLKKMAQRLYDYGLPPDTIFISKQVDLWLPTISSVLNRKLMNKPSVDWFKKQLF